MREQKQRKGNATVDVEDEEDVSIDIIDPTEALEEAKRALKRAEQEQRKEKARRNCGCW